jgi:hypothetical protein
MSTFTLPPCPGRPDLTALAAKYGTDKGVAAVGPLPGHKYTYIYEKHLHHLWDKEISLLEIGVLNGSSLRMWEEYFPNAKLYGIDINPECRKHSSSRSTVFIGDATNPEFMEKNVFPVAGDSFDIIIDDGSHQNDHIIKAAEYLFSYVKYGGHYFIEDFVVTAFEGTCWYAPYKGFRDFFEFAAYLNREIHFGGGIDSMAYRNGDNRVPPIYRDKSRTGCSVWNESLYSIAMYTNLCVLERQDRLSRTR